MTTRDQWIAKSQTAAKGKPFDAETALQGRISGPTTLRADHAPWKIFQRVDHADDLEKAASQASEDLANGADGLVITSADVLGVLNTLELHKVHLRNEAGDEGAEGLRVHVSKQPLDPARLSIDFGIQDPTLTKIVHGDGFTSPLMKSDGTMFHTEGADDATELGCILAETLGRWRMLEFLDDSLLSRAVSVKLIANQDVFGTIAKFRAMRILWRELLSAVGLPDAVLALHGETSRLMLASTDAHTNILRISSAVFGAALGGADSICALPMSFQQGLPNGFARRVARNCQVMLQHESHLWRMADPAAGAGAIERQTQLLCDKAWTVMQRCERGDWPGGDAGQSRSQPVIGVSKFKVDVEPRAETEGVA
jgi:methylmalonyl-CoA mutase